MNLRTRQLVLALCLFPLSGVAVAHPGHSVAAGFASGFIHPLSGLDHMAAMLAVGMWACFTAGRRAWIPIVAFMGFMSIGAVVGFGAMPLPGIEAGIAASLLVTGLLLVSLVRLPIVASVALVGGFALFHGHAHGVELPLTAAPWLYCLGFLFATGILNLCGFGFGLWARAFRTEWVLRGAGVLTSGFGAWLLLGA
jgi:urease accessory protein